MNPDYLKWCQARCLTPNPTVAAELRQRQIAALRRFEEPVYDDAAILRALRAKHLPALGALTRPNPESPPPLVKPTRIDDLDDAEIDRIRRVRGIGPSRHAERMGVPVAVILAAKYGEGAYKGRGCEPPVPRGKGRITHLSPEAVDEIRRNAPTQSDEEQAERLGVTVAVIARARAGNQGYEKLGTVPPVKRAQHVAVIALSPAQVDAIRRSTKTTVEIAQELGVGSCVVGHARCGRGAYAEIGTVAPCPDGYPPELIRAYDALADTMPAAKVAAALGVGRRTVQALRLLQAARSRRARAHEEPQ